MFDSPTRAPMSSQSPKLQWISHPQCAHSRLQSGFTDHRVLRWATHSAEKLRHPSKLKTTLLVIVRASISALTPLAQTRLKVCDHLQCPFLQPPQKRNINQKGTLRWDSSSLFSLGNKVIGKNTEITIIRPSTLEEAKQLSSPVFSSAVWHHLCSCSNHEPVGMTHQSPLPAHCLGCL